VGELCGVKPHVLRYWEQEFTQLRPMKRRGNRRYYQHHEVLMIRRIRELLYDQGFTISGARNKLQELGQGARAGRRLQDGLADGVDAIAIAGESAQPDGIEGSGRDEASDDGDVIEGVNDLDGNHAQGANGIVHAEPGDEPRAGNFIFATDDAAHRLVQLRRELREIRELLSSPW
jgi:DNA-binding transcriptional MerR regulator